MFLASLHFTVFRPKTTVWPSLGRISVEILMATTRSRQFFRWLRRRRQHFVHSSKLFYSIEVLHIHITCLHVCIVYIYFYLLPRTPDCVMAEAGITEFFGETQTDGTSARISRGILGFSWDWGCACQGLPPVPTPQPLQKNSADPKATFADNDDVAPQQVLVVASATLQWSRSRAST